MLQAQQGGANRQAQRDLDVAGMAQDRALQAGGQASTLAGNMGQQEFNQQAQVAAARDAANKFNAQQFGQTSQFNVGNQLRADVQNQGKTQGVYDKLATAKMEQERQNKFVSPQAQFQAGATKAGGLAGAGQATAKYYGDREDTAKKAQSGLWGGAYGLAREGLSAVPWDKMSFGGSDQSGGTPATNFVEADKGGTQPGYEPLDYSQEKGTAAPGNYVEQRNPNDETWSEKPYKPYRGY
jgi:hypothetical protein